MISLAVFISQLCPSLGWLLHCRSTVFNIKSELFFLSSGVILAVTIRDLKIQHRDGNENVKKITRLISKTITLHVHHTYLYISLPFLHDYDMKPHFAFYGERKEVCRNNCFKG